MWMCLEHFDKCCGWSYKVAMLGDAKEDTAAESKAWEEATIGTAISGEYCDVIDLKLQLPAQGVKIEIFLLDTVSLWNYWSIMVINY